MNRGLLRDDRGQTLVYVILFIAAFSIMLPMVISFSTSGIIQGRALSDLARDREVADAGAEYGLRRVKAGLASDFAAPGPTVTSAPSVNVNNSTASAQVTVQRRDIAAIVIEQLAPVTPDSGVCEGLYRVRATLSDASTIELPYGVIWSAKTGATPASGVDQGGRFRPTTAVAHTLTAQFANLRASFTVIPATPNWPSSCQ